MILDQELFNTVSKKSRTKILCVCDNCNSKKYISKSDIFRRGNVYTLCQKCTVLETSKKNIGMKRTEEFKKNRSISFKEAYSSGKRIPTKGKINSGSFKKGAVPVSKGKTHLDYPNIRHGKNATNWRGGVTSINIAIRSCNMMTLFNKLVIERDNYKCTKCGINNNKLEIHHIIPVSQIIKSNNINNLDDARLCNLLWDTTNGITVCFECHKKIDVYRSRRVRKVK